MCVCVCVCVCVCINTYIHAYPHTIVILENSTKSWNLLWTCWRFLSSHWSSRLVKQWRQHFHVKSLSTKKGLIGIILYTDILNCPKWTTYAPGRGAWPKELLICTQIWENRFRPAFLKCSSYKDIQVERFPGCCYLCVGMWDTTALYGEFHRSTLLFAK